MSKINIKSVLPVLIILGAIGCASMFMVTSPTAPKMEPRRMSPQVEAVYAERGNSPLFIEELGTLVASQSIMLKSKVSGTIASLSSSFEAGKVVKKGTTLLTLDSKDYKIALDKSLASLAKVKADYALEQGQQSVAQSDFNQLRTVMPDMKMSTAEANLALRKPQLEQAKASVAIAEADVATARSNLNDTTLKAPFSGIISSRLASTGQRITTSESLGELIATDKYHIEVGIAVDTLYSNKILSMEDEDLHIEVLSKSGDIWEGNLLQIVGVLATGSRLGKMLVSVDDPLALDEKNTKVPLLLGDQVTIRLEVGLFDDVFVVPRAAVRSNNTVWIIEDGKAKNIAVQTIWKDTKNMYIQSDEIPDKILFLTTDTLSPVDGMELTASITNQEDVPVELRSTFVSASPQGRGRGQGQAQGEQGQAQTGERPANATGERPANATGERPANATGERPANATGERMRPENATGERPANATGERPANATGERPANATGERPANATGERMRPENATGERPANATGERMRPENATGQRPEGMPMRSLLEEDATNTSPNEEARKEASEQKSN